MSIELPRKLEDYFAYAEMESTREGRRFSITLPYFDGTRVDQLQWWWRITPQQEQHAGETALADARAAAAARFARHIERWLINTRNRLHGDELIPRISPLESPAGIVSEPQTGAENNVLPWPYEKAANQ